MKQIKHWLQIIVGISMLQGVTALAAVTPEHKLATEWLQKMADAVSKENYQGRSIFHNGNRMMSLKIVHGIIDGEPWDRVVHLSGEPAEILRKGGRIQCLHPNDAVELTTKASEVPLFQAFTGGNLVIPERYQLRVGREGRVAGRLVQVINVIPLDRARYGYQLGIDKETGVLLKTAMFNGKGKALEVFEFVNISIGDSLSKADFTPGDGVQWVEKTVAQDLTQHSDEGIGWTAKWLPQGFELAEHTVRHLNGADVNAHVYSDGLAAFTVFMEKFDQGRDVEGSKQRGATVALSRRLQSSDGGYLVTVVGEVPMETAMQVAASVTRDN